VCPCYLYRDVTTKSGLNFIGIGATEPNYLVTADDVDTLLAIEVQPLDDRKRKVTSLPCADLYSIMLYFLNTFGNPGAMYICIPFEMTQRRVLMINYNFSFLIS
jgi:hypothetical protein